ncbi:unnamed protein product, partial [Didymodactylos carnosus]
NLKIMVKSSSLTYDRSTLQTFIELTKKNNSSFLSISHAYDTTNTSLLYHTDKHKYPILQQLTIYITFVLSVIGLVGNACTIIVLNQRSMRKWRSSTLLTALAIVDFVYLLIIFLALIDNLTNNIIGLNRYLMLCQVTVYITHICSFLSANYTLSFTFQRFIAVWFPLHSQSIISYRSSITNIIVLIIIACGFYSFSFLFTNIEDGQCKEDDKFPALFPLLIVDVCLTFVVPFTFILLSNCAIVYSLRTRKMTSRLLGIGKTNSVIIEIEC